MKRLQLSTVYLGGFLGPFTSQSLVAVLTDVSSTFDITVQQTSLAITAYLLPFSLVMLAGPKLAERFSLRCIILVAYTYIAAGSLALIVIPQWWAFVIVFSSMGIANAFTTPLLQVVLRQLVPANRLATSIGTFSAMQSLGLFSAPLLSGVLAQHLNWRLVYLITFVLSLWILLVRIPEVEYTPPAPGTRRFDRFLLLNIFTCFVIGFGIIGIGFMISLEAQSQYALDLSQAGLVVACGGAAGFLFTRIIGKFADHKGTRPTLLICLVVAVLALFAIMVSPNAIVFAAMWALATLACQGIQISINVRMLAGPNSAGGVAFVQSARFMGVALAPMILVQIYQAIGNRAVIISIIVLVICLVFHTISKPRPVIL